MSSDFAGKVVIVTGSSSGIGQAAAVLFGKLGASVTIHGRSEEGLQKTKNLLLDAGVPEARIHSVRGSVTDAKVQAALIEETAKKFGRIDILINNAGGLKSDAIDERSMEVLDYSLDLHLKAPIALTELAIPYLEKTKGNIVNVSGNDSLRTFPPLLYYSIVRAGLDHFAKNYAAILAPSGIRINNLNPGFTATPAIQKMGVPAEVVEQMIKDFLSEIPLGRAAMPEEMAEFLAFIASEKASYMTGQCVVVDGGNLIYSPSIKFE